MSDPTLPELMADAARELQSSMSKSDDLMDTATQLAVRDIDGCDAAALLIVRGSGVIENLSATGDGAKRVDEIEVELKEGPCWDAIKETQTVYIPDLADAPRWPTWAPKVVEETGFKSVLAFQLFTDEDNVGALNLFSRTADGFGTEDHEYGLALSAHVSVAIRAAQQIETLSVALDTRSTIARAQGILMERFSLEEPAAFAVLVRLSSHLNRKVRDVAAEIVQTRQLPG
ncbi:GAF and ANTAR domain-containing protein [Nocardioides sp. S-58]|uniref:GAF and ANTAR domain-containing protein n=1 Tax=Nocardioides renjunii TaxID=3095075 RepID=A0ABU5KBG2_9ACTN|nr:GAF and ANTAR domain-containing protein [Nocardioides sp. S-58]MDZ5662309.1 GAF and ANTAR domain-containing protein [Nocardioides sp. S-58]